jgi:beta-glucosidase
MRLQDTPSYLNFPGEAGHVRYGEGVMVGYRYYETVELPVRYPFGHGLSYTTFATSGLTVTRTGDDRATVTVRVTNTGDRPGKHVVQVYVSTAAGPVRRPVRELRAFTKVSLAPGESRTVTLRLDRRAFAYYDVPLGRWVVAPGDYTIQIGENASSVVAETTISLGGDSLVPVVSLDSTLGEWLSHPLAGPALLRVLTGGKGERPEEDDENGLRMASSMPMGRFLTFAGIDIPHATLRELVELGGSDGAAA